MKWFDKAEFKNTTLSNFLRSGTYTGEAKEKVIRYTKVRTIFSLVIIAVLVLFAVLAGSGINTSTLGLIILGVLFVANIAYQIISRSTVFHLNSIQSKQNRDEHQANQQNLLNSAEALKNQPNDEEK